MFCLSFCTFLFIKILCLVRSEAPGKTGEPLAYLQRVFYEGAQEAPALVTIYFS